MTARIETGDESGFAAFVLTSPDGRLQATFLPELDMLCSSLRHDGDELLHLRAGVQAWADRGKTCGIPLLYPWANRLDGDHYEVDGRAVTLVENAKPPTRDANGLPNHGLLGGRTAWKVVETTACDEDATLNARFDFEHEDLLANFPFPHRVEMHVGVANGRMSLKTTVLPHAERPVPVSFGYHPYFRLPGLAREQWLLTLPVTRRLELDARSIPTGRVEDVRFETAPLGDRTFDDGYTGIAAPGIFAIEGGGRRLEVELDEGFPFVQVFAPAGSDFVCIEPMTAPANALVRGGPDLPRAGAGGFSATWTLRVQPSAAADT